jgi:hypothetical protein
MQPEITGLPVLLVLGSGLFQKKPTAYYLEEIIDKFASNLFY